VDEAEELKVVVMELVCVDEPERESVDDGDDEIEELCVDVIDDETDVLTDVDWVLVCEELSDMDCVDDSELVTVLDPDLDCVDEAVLDTEEETDEETVDVCVVDGEVTSHMKVSL